VCVGVWVCVNVARCGSVRVYMCMCVPACVGNIFASIKVCRCRFVHLYLEGCYMCVYMCIYVYICVFVNAYTCVSGCTP
jgi:hypothetical protein